MKLASGVVSKTLAHLNLARGPLRKTKWAEKNCSLIRNGVAKTGPCFLVVLRVRDKQATDLFFQTAFGLRRRCLEIKGYRTPVNIPSLST